LAYLEVKRGSRSENKILNELLPILGILFIIFFIIFNNDKINHPSFKTFFPIIGTCLFIWFSKKETLLGKVMSLKLLVGIGLISYSLYLWHYPIFSFLRITDSVQGNVLVKILTFIILILLSIITYFLIESPFRDKKKIKTKLFFSIIIFAGILIVTFNLLVVSKDGFKSRMPDVILNAVDRHGKEKLWDKLKQNESTCWGRIDIMCSFYEQNEKKIYLIGDSHFGTLMYDLNNKLSNRSYNFRPITARSFFYFNESLKLHSNGKIEEYYLRLQTKINKIVSESKNNIFIFGGASATYIFDKRFYVNNEVMGDPIVNYVNKDDKKFSSESLMNEFRELIENISKNNKVILVYPIPEPGFNLQYKLLKGRNWKLMQKNPTLFKYPYKKYMAINKEVFEFFDTLKNKNIHRVYPHKLFCNTKVKDQCLLHNEKDIFFSDEYHLSIIGAEMVNELLIEKIDNLYD
jgi:hypothetical protein